MELKIYNQNNELKLTVSPNSSSTVTEEVMGECAVSVGFTHTEFVMLDVNDYVEIDGVRYRIMAQYRPKQRNTQTYEYSVKFYAPIHQAENTLMLFTPDGEMTSEFVYDGGPREHLQLWVDNMNRIAGTNVWRIGSVISAENKTIEYRNIKCWDAAFGSNGIATAFETEMWADGYYINLCKAERGVRVDLGYMQGLTSLAQEENGELKFFTRLFPLGSTRNIDASKYGHARLQLPGGVKFVDKNVDIYGVKEEFEEEAFAEIYPKYIGTVQSVRTADFTSTEGRDYRVYYVKDDAMGFNPNDYEIPEYTKMIAFQTGELAGRGDDTGSFQANWHEDTKEWEIINTYPDEETQIPGGLIIPKAGDTYIPWNFRMPDEYIRTAEQAYLEAVNNYLDEYSFDTNKYSGQTDRNHIENNGIRLMMGLNVRLHSETYFSGGYKDTRITKVVRQLNDLCQATITCTDKIGTGWKASVQNNIGNLQYEVSRQAENIVFDFIRSYENKTPSDRNVFTALKALETLMRKDIEDYAPKMKTSSLESKTFVGGALGSGFQLKQNADGQTYLEVDRMYVRLKAYFDSLEIREISHIGGQLLLTAASMKCNYVEVIEPQPFYYVDGTRKVYSDGRLAYTAARYRCYFNADDGDAAVVNQFVIGDFAMCRQFNIKAGVHENVSNRYYWYEVVGVGDNYIDFSQGQCDEGSDIPQAGDTIVQLGNRNDPFRQNAILLSSVGDNAPCKILYQGINDYSLDGKAIIEEGFDSHSGQAYQKIYGKTYIGARDESSYLSFDPITQKLKVRGDVEVTGGFNNEIAQQMGYSDYAEMIALAQQGKTIISGGFINTSLIEAKAITADMMNADGITANNVDITGKITATSGSFNGEVTATSGSFTGTVNANDGVLGSMTIRDGSYEYGIFYNGDNTTLSMRPGMFMNIPYNVFTPEDGTPQSNVLFYLKRRRNNVYDRSIYIEGISEFYGRVGIGKANNTGMNQFLPALVVEGIGCYGQFCLDNKIIKSSTVLDNTYTIAFVEMSSSGGYIRLPSSNLTNGQILIIRKVDGSNFKIYGRIKNTSNNLVDEISITDASFNMFIYNKTYNYWVLNYMN